MAVVRQNVLGSAPLTAKYVQGVVALKNDFLRPGTWPSTYDIFVIWHHQAMMTMTPATQNSRNAAHSGPAFLPWHRYMLLLFEHHLQRVLGDTTFGLPYWNWAADGARTPAQQLTSRLWGSGGLGENRGQVTLGGLAAFRVQFVTNASAQLVRITPRVLQRNAGVDVTTLPKAADVQTATSLPDYDTAPWDRNSQSSFRNRLEGWDQGPRNHNRVHVWVGGDMGPASSPNDPVFYLNHCNVDRVWAGWQGLPGRGTFVPVSGTTSPAGHRLNDRLMAITTSADFDPLFRGSVRIAQVQDASSFYSYDSTSDITA